MHFKEINISKDYLIYNSFDRIDYWDAFMIEERFDKELTLEDVVKSLFRTIPFWVDWLGYIRDKIVKPFGLKTSDSDMPYSSADSFKGRIGETIVFFTVYDRSENEIMLGAEDKHLDAMFSFLLKKNQNRYQIMLVTTVHFNYWLGNAYFSFVKPFHRMIIKACLKRMVLYLKRSI